MEANPSSDKPRSTLILVIEDDVDVSSVIADVLETEGYRVAVAANGREALERLGDGLDPSLILLDLMMPVMDGWTFREEQRKDAALAAIPVVTVTADGNARNKAAKIGAQGYLAKPLSIDGLLGEIGRVLASESRAPSAAR